MKRFKDTLGFAFLLNLLCPGLGHVYWRECIFGVFIFLITLLAVVLFFLAVLVTLPPVAKLVLFGLPVIFYLFTFLDLGKAVMIKRGTKSRDRFIAAAVLVLAVMYQVLAPTAPTNFFLRNRPEVFRASDNSLSPFLGRGDLAAANSLAYKTKLFFLDRPVWHQLPQRGDVVRFVDFDLNPRTGLMLGLPGEQVEVVNGLLVVDGYPFSASLPDDRLLQGDMSLTSVEPSSILVAELKLGVVDKTYQVPIDGITGRVYRLF